MTLPDLPPPHSQAEVPKANRPIAFAAVIGGGICLFAVIVGLTLLGLDSDNEVTDTGLAAIGSTLAGGWAGWIARGAVQQNRRDQ